MSKVVVGYRYYLGMHLGVCAGPVDSIMEIRAGDRTAWTGNVTANTSIAIAAPELFGGDEKEGGLNGTLDVMMGAADQTQNGYLALQHGPNAPAYRGILSLVWQRGLVAANNPYLKPWAVKVRRILQGWQGGSAWYSAKAAITLPNGVGKGMNPAHIVYECITNADWGMGYGSSLIDDANFRAAADTFYAEGFGLCIQWTRQQSIEGFLQHIMDHSGSILTQDRETGLFKITPLRADYVVSALPAFDESNIIELESYQRPALPDAVNEVSVKYEDLATGTEASITVQNLANITSQGGVVSQSASYPGLPTGDLAMRVALRDLRVKSTPLAKVRFRANRSAANLLPGDVIKFSWPKLGIDALVLRVLKVNAGTVVDGAVSIDAAEDVFGMPSSSYAAQPPTGWTDPSTPPAVADYRVVREATFYETVVRMGSDAVQALPVDAGYVMAAAVRPSGDSVDFGLQDRTGSGAFELTARGPFMPGAALLAGINHVATSATIGSGVDLDLVETGTFAQIDEEIVRIDAINIGAGTLTIGRGVLDTVAATHSAGARISFLQDYAAADETQRVDGEVVDVKLTPRTGRGELALGSAPIDSVTLDQRIVRPYPPGKFRITTLAYPTTVVDPLAISWAHRDRKQQNLEGDESGNIGPEAGTTYSLEIRNAGGTVIAAATGLTGTSYSAPGSLQQGTLNVRLWSVRGGLASRQRHDWTFAYTAPVIAPGKVLSVGAGLVFRSPGASIAMATTQTAQAIKPASGWHSKISLVYMGAEITSVVQAGSVITMQMMRLEGSTWVQKGNTSLDVPVDMSTDTVLAAFTSFINGDPVLSGYGWSATVAGPGGRASYLEVFGPVTDTWQIWVIGAAPSPRSAWWGMEQTILDAGGPAITTERPQLVTATITGSPNQGDSYTITVGGVAYTYVMPAPNTSADLALNLAGLIDAAANFNASYVGNVITISGITGTNTFGYSTSSFAAHAYVVPDAIAPGATLVAAVSLATGGASAGDGYDPSFGSVVLLLHGRGANNSQTFTDSSLSNKATSLVTGQVKITTSVYKWNGSSIVFDGTADKFDYASSADFNLGSTFTIEFWAKPNTLPGSGNTCRLLLFGSNGSGSALTVQFFNDGSVVLAVPAGGSTAFGAGGAFTVGQWDHHAFSVSAGSCKYFKNGVQQGSTTSITTQSASGGETLTVGYDTPATVNYQYDGYLEDLRITKGVARYAANFSAPSGPLPDGPAPNLLLHFNGANGSTTLTDSSPDVRTVTANGTAALSTALKKFGTASLALDGSSGCNATFSSPALSGDFTAEAWAYVTDTGVSRDVITFGGAFTLYRQSANVLALFRNAGGATLGSTTFTANAWHHVAVTRKGSTIRFFLDGNLEGSVTDSTSFSTGTAYIGSYSDGSERWVGNIDEMRLIAGTAMYTANFTPPTAEFP